MALVEWSGWGAPGTEAVSVALVSHEMTWSSNFQKKYLELLVRNIWREMLRSSSRAGGAPGQDFVGIY